MDDLYQTVVDMKEITCTEETCSTIKKEVEMLDTEIKTVQVVMMRYHSDYEMTH